MKIQISDIRYQSTPRFNPLNAQLNPTCHLLALLGAHHILHVSRIRIKHTFYAMTLRISDIRAQHDFNVSSLQLGRVMLPAATDSNVKTLAKTVTNLLSMVTLPC
jgi:hypothetical protein